MKVIFGLLLVMSQASAFSSTSPVVVKARAIGVPSATTTIATSSSGSGSRLLRMSLANSDEEFATAFTYNLRKNRLVSGYKATTMAYVAYFFQVVRVHGGFTQPYALYLAIGPLLAAGLSYILTQSTNNDTLGLFTSKRYNLALLGYAGISLALVGLAQQLRKPLFIIPPLLATISCMKGYASGVRGWDLQKPAVAIVCDLKKSTAQTLSSLLKVPKTMQASAYTAATLLLAAMKLAKVKEIIEMIASSSSQSNLLVPLARLARLSLFTAVVYSLKDAADRKMLEGESFIQLNLLSAASFGALASFLLKKATPKSTQLPIVGGAAAFFSVFCACNGAASILKKKST